MPKGESRREATINENENWGFDAESSANSRPGHSRVLRALAKQGAKLAMQGRDDSTASERAADVVRRAWLARTATGGFTVPDDVPHSADKIARVCDALDDLSVG